MIIIDAHIHFSRIASFKDAASHGSGCDYSLAGLQTEITRNHVSVVVGMGLQESLPYAFPDAAAPNPMGLDLSDSWPEELYSCPGINPYNLTKESLDGIEKALQFPRTVGIKLYTGYYPFYVTDPVYEPVYDLAARYKLPVLIHSGDTFSDRALIKYAHPLTVDELAVRHRRNTFVITHMGDPWIRDAGQIIRKNANVWTDVAGLLVGSRRYFEESANEPLILNEFRYALISAASWDKILFGSDWPLAPMDVYRDFVSKIVPDKHLENVLGKNALNLFGRISIR
ncbi:MAG: amidohydrolase family protein [Deltaproteobacteria bacterium]|nr:amidohydrolase family protein [Deltaproteobacteria bacterium]